MDFLTKQEIEKLKGELSLKDSILETEKYVFERELKNGLGDNIIKILNNPPKPNIWLKLKLKFIKWKFLKKEKQYIKNIKNNEDY